MRLLRHVADVISRPGVLTSLGLSMAGLLSWRVSKRATGKWLSTLAVIAAISGLVVDQAAFRLALVIGSLWLAGEVACRVPGFIAKAVIIAGPAVALGFLTGVPQRWPSRVGLVGFVVVAWFAVTRQDSATGLTPQLLAISTVGLFFTIPSTDEAVILLAALPVVVIPAVTRFIPMGYGGSAAFIGLFSWIAVVGGVARPPSIVGALAGLGVIWVEPVLTYFGHFAVPGGRDDWRDRRILLAAQGVTVAICSRVAGLQIRTGPAVLLAVVGLVVGGSLLFTRRRSPTRIEGLARDP